jgi:hypothetical protein
MFSIIQTAYAQTPGAAEAAAFVDRVNEVILFPLIALLFALALFVFIYGCYQYIAHAGESSAHEAGRMHILWGIIGMFVMLVAYAILGIAANTFGLNNELDCASDPTQGGCDEVFRFTGPGITPPSGSGSVTPPSGSGNVVNPPSGSGSVTSPSGSGNVVNPPSGR